MHSTNHLLKNAVDRSTIVMDLPARYQNNNKTSQDGFIEAGATTTTDQRIRKLLPFDQLKRAVSSNLPCFFMDFVQSTTSHQPLSVFEAREHDVVIQQFSLVGWSGKRLKLEVNNKKDYMTSVTIENGQRQLKVLQLKLLNRIMFLTVSLSTL
jgi:hypothetical protein